MQFAGYITAIDKRGDDTNTAAGTLVELVDFQRDSMVEIAFDDRNERCYVKFKLTDLMAALAEFSGKSTS